MDRFVLQKGKNAKRHRLTTVTEADPDGGGTQTSPVTTYLYDAVGNRSGMIGPLGRETNYEYDGLDRLIRTQEPDPDDTGPLESPVIEYGYNAVGNLLSVTDPLQESTFFEYDAAGNLTQSTDREGRDRTFAYDNLDRLITETWLDGMATTNTLTFTYDAVGNLLTADDDFSAYTLDYDNLYRLIQSDNAGTPGVPNVVLDYEYDAVGNRTSVTDNSGVTVDSVYDDLDRLTSRTWDGGNIDPARIDFGYDARGQRTSADRFSNLAGTQQIGRSAYAYDAVGRISEIDHFDDLDASLAEYDYTYDLAGQITQWLHHGETIDFTHDAAGQLTDADYSTQSDEDYTYDANGNRTGTGLVIGANNQVLSDGTYDYEYDAEGNLILKTEIVTSEYTEYTYDHRNRMTSATTFSTGAVILQEVEFTYDVLDRRIAKTVDADGAGSGQSETIYTVYDGEHAWTDFDESAAVVARYLFGDLIDEILARWQPTEGTAWYLTDHLGTVRDIVDDSGTLINTITYDSFGNIVGQTNATAGDRFTYTGREYDAELDLYYYRARYYDPRLGRFVSQDPIGFAAGDANLYRYVANRVTTTTDPTGLVGLFDPKYRYVDGSGRYDWHYDRILLNNPPPTESQAIDKGWRQLLDW